MAEAKWPPPVTTEQMYLAAVLDEVRGLRADMARSPGQSERALEEIREPVTTRPADSRPADDEAAKSTAAAPAKKTTAKTTAKKSPSPRRRKRT